MTPEEFQNAKSLWKMEYAHATFESVQDGINSLLGRHLKQSAPEYYSLSVGIVCLYCRPFTYGNHVGRIFPEIVPEEYRDSHKLIVQFRHEIFAHSDAGSILGPDQYMNAVKLEKRREKFAFYITKGTVLPEFFERIRPLVSFLVEETNRRRFQLLAEIQTPVLRARDGFYRLNVFDQSGPAFIEIEENWPGT